MQEIEQIKNSGRRRLAKGVLAGPAVLASITSKHALGATYVCAVSGQQSGNVSQGKNSAPVNCVAGFKSWKDRASECGKNAESRSRKAPAEFGVMYTAPHDPKKGAPPLAVAATYHQIYSNVAGLSYTRGGDNALLQAAATVYLNALEWPVDYHVKAPMCLKLFDVAAGNQSILDNGHKTSWDAGMCRQYLKTLAGL